MNDFISAYQSIFVETDKTKFEDVDTKVASIIRNIAFMPNQEVVFRIFADENLKLGYIWDVHGEMRSGCNDNVQTLKYLLKTRELNIDGQDWFKSINMQKLKRTN
ncbi:hypothetical protein [Salinimicrobium sp. GXAS 041]|uniref:hypothetical protein n=1 Tax=Salinimicrobium sp. GXAS 041 TaxID=3400806 RepID=UPI003C74434D